MGERKRQFPHLGERLEKSQWRIAKKMKKKRFSKRLCQNDLLSKQFIGLDYQVRKVIILAKNEIIGKTHQLIIKKDFFLSAVDRLV